MDLREKLTEKLQEIDLSNIIQYDLEETIAGCGIGTNRDQGICSGTCGSGISETW